MYKMTAMEILFLGMPTSVCFKPKNMVNYILDDTYFASSTSWIVTNVTVLLHKKTVVKFAFSFISYFFSKNYLFHNGDGYFIYQLEKALSKSHSVLNALEKTQHQTYVYFRHPIILIHHLNNITHYIVLECCFKQGKGHMWIREYAPFTADEYIVYEIKMSFSQMMFYLQDRFMPDVSRINLK